MLEKSCKHKHGYVPSVVKTLLAKSTDQFPSIWFIFTLAFFFKELTVLFFINMAVKLFVSLEDFIAYYRPRGCTTGMDGEYLFEL